MKKGLSLSIVALATLISACGGASQVPLQGAGATFPAPIYTQLFADYYSKTGIPVSYQAVGSGAGIQNINEGIVDFGASDAFMSDAELATAPAELLHIPAVLASVNFTYNLPELGTTELKLDADTLQAIYSGTITQWNDPRIQALNPEINLPAITIIPVYRSDSSGTTFVMSEAMSKASSEWANTLGTGKSLNWITGVGQRGSAGVMGYLKENVGAITYADLVYAVQSGFPVAQIKNAAGNFVTGDIANTSEAAANIVIPADGRTSLTFAQGANSAPMATFSYILVRQEQNYNNRTLEQAQTLVKLLQWMFTPEAQAQHASLYFAPMPQEILDLEKTIIAQITYDGEPVIDTLTE